MNTPLCDFVKKYNESGALRAHMPGHKGVSVLGVEGLDITEISGADELYNPTGIILESEENAASLFGTAKTVFSTEGSSLPIRAMLYMTKLYAGGKASILAARNAHKVFVSAAALLGIEVEGLYPNETSSITECKLSASDLEAKLKTMAAEDKLPTAVYITSPDYLGNIADIKSMAEVSHKYGCILLVDNAHGAYLKFMPEDMHPISLGADMCCDSAHKTLPVLTGGAYLHISKNAPKIFKDMANKAMALFASTSPSYIIMQSLDQANAYMAKGYSNKLSTFVERITEIKNTLTRFEYTLVGDEALKLTIKTKLYGYLGKEYVEFLSKNNMVPEYYDDDYVVLMLSPEWDEWKLSELLGILLSVPKRAALSEMHVPVARGKASIKPHDVIFMESEEVKVEEALGRVVAHMTVSCPPAIPIVSLGEEVTKEAIELMKYYGHETVEVVRN